MSLENAVSKAESRKGLSLMANQDASASGPCPEISSHQAAMSLAVTGLLTRLFRWRVLRS